MPKPLSVVKAETVSGTRTGTGRGSNNNKPHQHHHHLHHYYWWWCCCCSRHQHNHSNRKGLSSQTFGLVVLGAMFLSLALNVYLSAKLGMLENIQTMEQDFIQRWTSSSSSSTSTSSAESVAALSLLSTVVANNNVNARTSIPLRDTTGGHNLAGLRCEKFGGPSPEVAQEMVYWEDIPSDSMYVSPFKRTDQRQYLSFEPGTCFCLFCDAKGEPFKIQIPYNHTVQYIQHIHLKSSISKRLLTIILSLKYLLACLLACLLTYLLTYLLTCLLICQLSNTPS